MEESKVQNINHLYDEVREIIVTARQNAVRSVDFSRVQMYWQIGRRILEEEQKGKERADYGTYLLKNLAKKLEPEYGSGFSYRQLNFCRQFYRMYPIANALRSQFNWTQYRLLIAISDDCKREYYELEAMNHCWTARELERQINSQLYERLLLSKYAGRSYTRYALLAGYTEIGETLEQTVHREVMEEVGLRVKNIRYYKSQPWGVAGNLSIGYFCDLDGDDTVRLDENELASAEWFDRNDLPAKDDGISLTREMIRIFSEGKEPK